jgi:retron-type reverse transcriptase
VQALRHWDYYGMTSTFTDLHERAANRETFTHLYDIITSRENILLAFRTIKSNEGSQTPGTDGKTIADMKKLTDDELVALVQHTLKLYRPKKVRRTFIEKYNGKLRPLGIPCMVDRLIQQCCKQVLEPIAEAHFYMHSYGFRPLRSTHHAMARAQYLFNIVRMHYVVDIDIKGFFDNVNHTLLIKQCWNMGIRDKKVLRIISKMLKADIEKLKGHIVTEIIALMNANIIGRTVEYLDNRISRYSMRSGKCEITGMFLIAMDVHCHHVLPVHLGGSDKYSNLRILHKDVHKLIHATQNQTIERLKA